MLVKTLNDSYRIRFFHNTTLKRETIGNQHLKRGQRFSICTIENLKENGEVVMGYAFCSKKDQFCRKTGRKIAFFDAIKLLPKSERKLLVVEVLLKGL